MAKPKSKPKRAKKAKKPVKSSIPKEFKDTHKQHLTSFTKALHVLGVNVQEHAKNLGIEEAELRDIEAKIESESYITDPDKVKLRGVLDDIFYASNGMLNIEKLLYETIKPFIEEARNKIPLTHMRAISALEKLHGGLYKKSADKFKEIIPEVRNLIMASMHNEWIGIFKPYPALLDKVATACKGLVELERKWGNKGEALRREFFAIHQDLRKILHEDIYTVSKEIVEVYDMRLNLYWWLIEANNKLDKKLVPTLEKEYNQMLGVQNRYIVMFKMYSDYLRQLYTKGRVVA